MGWNRPGEILTLFPSALESAMGPRNSRNWVERMMVYGNAGCLDQFFLGDLGAEIAIVAPVGSDDG
jgi:hypothetical protein